VPASPIRAEEREFVERSIGAMLHAAGAAAA
jgi:hypothetical protein